MLVVLFFTPSSVDSTCEQNGNVQTVKSVNDSRPGAEQTEAEGTVENEGGDLIHAVKLSPLYI